MIGNWIFVVVDYAMATDTAILPVEHNAVFDYAWQTVDALGRKKSWWGCNCLR